MNSELALQQLGYTIHHNAMTETVEVLKDERPERPSAPLVPSLIRKVWDRFRFEPPSFKVQEALSSMARANEYHPLRNMLDALPPWDGRPRPLLSYVQAQGDEAERQLYGIWLELWLSAVLARAYRPGCAWENMIVLQGRQGCGKTRFVRALAGPAWYYDHVPFNADEKVWIETIRNYWILECSELRGLKSGAWAEQIKQRLSAPADTARLAWERAPRERPRHCVFIGTTNVREVLFDPTGLRRFWPIPVQGIDADGAARDRDQILAEHLAKGLWRTDATLQLPPQYWPLGARIASRFRERNPFEEYALEQFGDEACASGWLTIPDCNRKLEQALGRRLATKEQGLVRDAMATAGWERTQRLVPSGSKPRVYVKGIERGSALTAALRVQ